MLQNIYSSFGLCSSEINTSLTNAPVSSSLEEINCMKLSYFCLSSIDGKGCFLSMPIAIHMIYSKRGTKMMQEAQRDAQIEIWGEVKE